MVEEARRMGWRIGTQKRRFSRWIAMSSMRMRMMARTEDGHDEVEDNEGSGIKMRKITKGG